MKKPRQHELKSDPASFQCMWDGVKNFDLRFNDRNFQVGEMLILKETLYSGKEMKANCPLKYTGREIHAEILHMTDGPKYGLKKGYVAMSIRIHKFKSNQE